MDQKIRAKKKILRMSESCLIQKKTFEFSFKAGPPTDQALIDPSDMSKSQPLADERDASNAESIDWDNRLLTLLSRLNQGGISDEDDDLKENNYQVKDHWLKVIDQNPPHLL